jgi:hypothetical protein
MYPSRMAVLALYVPGHSPRSVGLGILLAIVLLAALAAAAYFVGRQYVSIGRRGHGREQSLRPLFILGLTILGLIALVGLYWK